MAKVEMDLNELKALEAKLENLEKEKQALIDKQMMVIVHHKHFKGKIKVTDYVSARNVPGVRVTGIQIIESRSLHHSSRTYEDRYYGQHMPPTRSQSAFDNTIDLQQAIEAGYLTVDITEDTTRTTKDYKNLSEVESEIRTELRQELEQQITRVNERANAAEYQLTVLDSTHQKSQLAMVDAHQAELVGMEKVHRKEIETMTENYNLMIDSTTKAYKELEEKYQDLKDDKKRISLEKQIDDLVARIDMMRHRTFWQRLINYDGSKI